MTLKNTTNLNDLFQMLINGVTIFEVVNENNVIEIHVNGIMDIEIEFDNEGNSKRYKLDYIHDDTNVDTTIYKIFKLIFETVLKRHLVDYHK